MKKKLKFNNKLKKVLLSAIVLASCVGLAAGVVIPILLIKSNVLPIKKDLTNIYTYDNDVIKYMPPPTDEEIFAFVKSKNSEINIMSINDFEWTNGETNVELKVKNSNTKYKGTITINYDVKDAILINNTNVNSFLTSEDSLIYWGTSPEDSITIGHKLLKLKELCNSLNNVNITNFVIDGEVDFGFLVDPDMDCHIYGKNNAIAACGSVSEDSAGVIVGRTVASTSANWNYDKNLTIDKSITFNLYDGAHSYGVLFKCKVGGYINISGVFSISGGDSYAVLFYDDVSGNINISGVFSISGPDWMYGVQFYKKVTGIVNISGVFSVSGSYNTHGIEFNDDVNGTINISGVFSFYNTDDVLGILFKNGEVSGNINIYGTFSVSNSILSPGHDYATGVKFNSTISSDAIFNSKCDMPTFFSNRQDNGNWVYKTKNYEMWNGETIQQQATENAVIGTLDSDFAAQKIYDTEENPHFWIYKAIDGPAGNDISFNNKLKEELGKFDNEWIKLIIKQI